MYEKHGLMSKISNPLVLAYLRNHKGESYTRQIEGEGGSGILFHRRAGEKSHCFREFRKVVNDVVRLRVRGFFHIRIRAEENGFNPGLGGPVDVPVHVVSDEEDLIRGHIHLAECGLEHASVGFPESEVAGDDDRIEVAGEPDVVQFGMSPQALSVGDDGEAEIFAEFVEDWKDIRIDLEAAQGRGAEKFRQNSGEEAAFRLRQMVEAAGSVVFHHFPEKSDGVEFREFLGAFLALALVDLVIKGLDPGGVDADSLIL